VGRSKTFKSAAVKDCNSWLKLIYISYLGFQKRFKNRGNNSDLVGKIPDEISLIPDNKT